MLKHVYTTAFLAFSIALGAWGLAPQEAHGLPKFKLRGKWKLIKRRGQLKVYQMKVRGSRLIAMRGDAVFDAPISKVFYLLNNVPRKVKWVSRMIEARYIKKSSPTDYVVYTRFKFPWPTSHRDFVNRTETFFYPKKRQIIRYQYSVKDPSAPPKKGVVRAVVHYSSYTLTSIANDTKTRMRAVGYGDPKGSIPAFIVNFIQRRWPLKNMRTIAKQLKKPFVKPHPLVQKRLFDPLKPKPEPRAAVAAKAPARKAPDRRTPAGKAAAGTAAVAAPKPDERRPSPRK